MKDRTAGAWAESLSTSFLDPETSNPYETFEEFLFAFESAFGEPDQEFTAHSQLRNLKQGKMSVEEYMAHFDALAGRTAFGEEALIDAYQRGLNERLLEKMHLNDLPETLAGWRDVARQLDNLYLQFRQATAGTTPYAARTPLTAMEKPRTAAPAPRPTPAPPAAAASSSTSFAPMDIDSMQKQEA
jgi:Retrotransposon gag protein